MKSNISLIYHYRHHHSKSARTRTRTRTRTEESAISAPLLAFLAVTFFLNTYNLRSRPWDQAFVVVSYSNLLLLFCCIDTHHKSPKGSRRRKGLRAAVCFLCDTLLLAISYQVAKTMPPPVKVLVWAMAGATVSGITYGFIRYNPDDEDDDDEVAAAGTRTAAALEP